MPLDDSKNKWENTMSGLKSDPNTLEVQMGWKPHLLVISTLMSTSFLKSISVASVSVLARDFAGKVMISSWDYTLGGVIAWRKRNSELALLVSILLLDH